MQKSYFPSPDLLDLQARHRRRVEKELVKELGAEEVWGSFGAGWASREKRVRRINTHPVVPVSDKQIALEASTQKILARTKTAPVEFRFNTAPILYGAGVHNPGIPHYASTASTQATSRAGNLHGGRQAQAPRRGLDDLIMFSIEIDKAKKIALELAGKPGGGKAHKRVLSMEHAYRLEEARIKNGGVMERLRSFEEGAARAPKKTKPAPKNEGGRKDYR